MHILKFEIYNFIENNNKKLITGLNKKINIIYRNYNSYDEDTIIKIKNLCKKQGRKFYLSNNFDLAYKLGLDGVYIPSFNKSFSMKKNNIKKQFEIIGSAHNIKEIKIKERQMVNKIFLSPLFKIKKTKYFLDIHRFNNLAKKTKMQVIALGGINRSNIKKLKLVNCIGFASISFIKNNINYI